MAWVAAQNFGARVWRDFAIRAATIAVIPYGRTPGPETSA